MENRDEAGVETTAIAELVSLDRKRVLDVGRSSDYFVAAVHT